MLKTNQGLAEQLEMNTRLPLQVQQLRGNQLKENGSNKGKRFKVNTDSDGNFDLEIFDGLYKILIKADGYKKTILKINYCQTIQGVA